MTENKRFTIADYPTDIIDNRSGKKYPCSSYGTHMEIICDLLNELNEENEQLKQQLSSINQLIDNKIDEFKNGDYGDLSCNTIHMFLDLKEELKGDVE